MRLLSMCISRNAVLILALSLLSALTPLAIDMALPGFKSLEHDLGLAAGAGANTVSVFLLGFALGPLWFGPLSDSVGRKPVLYAGILLFSAGGMLCFFAPGAGVFFAGRLMQGVGAGVCSSIPLAIVRDSFEGMQGRRVLTLITLVMGVAPIIAPVIGAAVVATLGWRHVFSVLGVTGILLLLFVALGLRETSVAATRRTLSLRTLSLSTLSLKPMLAAYRQALGNRIFVGYALANGFSVGCMFAFVAASPNVFMGQFGVPASGFGLIFACIAAGIIAGAMLNDRLLSLALSPTAVLAGALLGSLASALLLLVSAVTGVATVISTVLLLIFNNLCSGMVRPNATHEAMQPLPHIAGSGSALFRAVQMLLGALAAATVGTVAAGQALMAMAGVMSSAALLSVLWFWWVSRSVHS